MSPSEFTLEGDYRVQSSRRPVKSRLVGQWIMPSSGRPSEAKVNAQLARHPFWRGRARVALRAAAIWQRSGAFTEPDILYKETHFVPARGTRPMGTNIVDVRKAADNWRRRQSLFVRMVGDDTFQQIEALIDDVERVAADEYFYHEAGHCLGYPTNEKYADGYFQIGGSTRWALVYAEELRADLLAFGLAAASMQARKAAALLIYNLLLRLGAEAEAKHTATMPYGPIPHLLVGLLQEGGWLEIVDSSQPLRFASLKPTDLVRAMADCADRTIAGWVEPEAHVSSRVDAAIVAARWLNNAASKYSNAADVIVKHASKADAETR